jgi:ubiquinone/menaquinone biosynthesis C-methylase UbiE
VSKLGLYLDQLCYATRDVRRFAHRHYEFFVNFEMQIGLYFDTLTGKRVLDVGCGTSYWLSLLLHSRGAQVTGVDIQVIEPPGTGPGKYWRLLRQNGLERMLKTSCWDAIYSRSYYDEMCKIASFPIRFDGLDLRQMDATQLDYPDSTFDLVVSHEVLEHLRDVPAALSEMQRTMRPGAIAYMYIHNYASLSGGHHIRWKYPDGEPPADVPPWDHLRENRFRAIPSYINRLRLHEYQQMFEEMFEVLEWKLTGREGERFLTPAIRAELSDHSEEELLTRGVIVIARPKR